MNCIFFSNTIKTIRHKRYSYSLKNKAYKRLPLINEKKKKKEMIINGNLNYNRSNKQIRKKKIVVEKDENLLIVRDKKLPKQEVDILCKYFHNRDNYC